MASTISPFDLHKNELIGIKDKNIFVEPANKETAL